MSAGLELFGMLGLSACLVSGMFTRFLLSVAMMAQWRVGAGPRRATFLPTGRRAGVYLTVDPVRVDVAVRDATRACTRGLGEAGQAEFLALEPLEFFSSLPPDLGADIFGRHVGRRPGAEPATEGPRGSRVLVSICSGVTHPGGRASSAALPFVGGDSGHRMRPHVGRAALYHVRCRARQSPRPVAGREKLCSAEPWERVVATPDVSRKARVTRAASGRPRRRWQDRSNGGASALLCCGLGFLSCPACPVAEGPRALRPEVLVSLGTCAPGGGRARCVSLLRSRSGRRNNRRTPIVMGGSWDSAPRPFRLKDPVLLRVPAHPPYKRTGPFALARSGRVRARCASVVVLHAYAPWRKVTTALSFFANMVSVVRALRQFGFFMGPKGGHVSSRCFAPRVRPKTPRICSKLGQCSALHAGARRHRGVHLVLLLIF